jgi:hypothetical protein
MRRRAAEALAVAGLAAIVTAAIALPVLRQPSTRVFGMDIVGRHHDPFTMMEQFGAPVTVSLSTQPVTDLTGAALARLAGPVAAYNWLVLISFPLAAAAAYLLARHLTLSPAAATVAAIAYAFAPFHLAQAAYHPHIAQTQWIPLYLLALWRCLDDGTPATAGLLAAATLGVTLSNLYGGAIAAVMTPVAVAAHWLVTRGTRPHALRRVAVTIGTLAMVAAAGAAYVWYAAAPVVAHLGWFAFPRADLFRYSAKWWSYLVPPVEHPWLGAVSRRIWDAAGVREGMLEQQVSLGAGVVILGLVAIARWAARNREQEALARVPVLVAVAIAALLCSLSPERTIGAFTFVRPSALMYHLAPMFRSYARFGVVVQLMAALLAGIGIDVLLRSGTTRARIACALLVLLAAGEYAVSPFALSRDVLPTRAHRWVMQQPDRLRVLDCTPLTQESASVQWLTGSRVTLLDDAFGDCIEPNVSARLAGEGFTHLLVRPDSRTGRAFFDRPLPPGLRLAGRFRDGQIFAVTAPPPAIYMAAMTRFWPREHDGQRTWRWMGADAAWTVVNTSGGPIVAALDIELWSFQHSRRLNLIFDGRAMQTLAVDPVRRVYKAGPFTMAPGRHELVFQAAEPPAAAGDAISADPRPLSCSFGDWVWILRGEQP